MSREGIKVQIGLNGKSRIIEELEDDVRVYTPDEWRDELERRNSGGDVAIKEEVEEESLIEETEEETAELGKGKKKTAKKY